MGLDTTKQDLIQSVLEGIALRAAEVIAAMKAEVGNIEKLSIDGGLSKNPYFVNFLTNALDMEIHVAASADITALGTARMALTGFGQENLPDLPAPRMIISPVRPRAGEMHAMFSKAVSRAKSWHED